MDEEIRMSKINTRHEKN